MSKAKSTTSGSTFTIVEPVRESGAMTVRDPTTNTTYEIVDYVDDILRERLAALDAGNTVTLELAPVADCTNVCRATQLRPGGLPQPGL
jgi:hypothetical protein